MSQTAIFLPVAALAMWTLVVLLQVPIRRFAAGAARKVTADDFKFGESARVPGDVSIANRAYMNLLEAPILFYVACLVCFEAGKVDDLILILAWAYVGLRAAHSLIHLTYNNVMHRLTAFAVSNVVLVALWVMLVIRIWPG
jgi:hypothetical protein